MDGMDSPLMRGQRPPSKPDSANDAAPEIPGPAGTLAWTITTQEVVALLGRKWVVPIVRELTTGTKRRFQLHNAIRTVSTKVLTDTLRFLERDGMIERVLHEDGHGSKSIVYQLTDLGRSLADPVTALYQWGREHLDEVHRSQQETDALWADDKVPPGARAVVGVPESPLQ